MNRYLIAAIAAVGIALSGGTSLACQKLNSASTESERSPDTQQKLPADTSQQPG